MRKRNDEALEREVIRAFHGHDFQQIRGKKGYSDTIICINCGTRKNTPNTHVMAKTCPPVYTPDGPNLMLPYLMLPSGYNVNPGPWKWGDGWLATDEWRELEDYRESIGLARRPS